MKGHIMSTAPLNSLEVTSAEGGGACKWSRCNKNGYLILCFYLCDQKQQSPMRTQTYHIFKTGSLWPTLAPANCEQADSGTHAQLAARRLRDRELVAATMLRAKID